MFSNIFLQGLGNKTTSKDSFTWLNQPVFYLALVFVLGFFHIGFLYLEYPSPLALLFVPLVYLTCKANENSNTVKDVLKHSMPFVALNIINILCYVTGLFESADFLKVYNIAKLTFALIIGVFYLFLTFSLNRKHHFSKSDTKRFLYNKLIGQLCILVCFMTGMGVLKLIISLTGETDFNAIVFTLWATLFILIRVLIVLTWYRAERQVDEAPFENGEERVTYDENMERNKINLLAYLAQSEIFLDPNLTLPVLAKNIDMSEREFSKLVNQYMGSSFYHLIARYRIAHAVKLIDEETGRYTIDAMAGYCGFNSKTSFNKYFKEFTGINPSEFRAKLANK